MLRDQLLLHYSTPIIPLIIPLFKAPKIVLRGMQYTDSLG